MRIFDSVFICGFFLFLLIELGFYAAKSFWTDDWDLSLKSGLYHGSPFEYLIDQGIVFNSTFANIQLNENFWKFSFVIGRNKPTWPDGTIIENFESEKEPESRKPARPGQEPYRSDFDFLFYFQAAVESAAIGSPNFVRDPFHLPILPARLSFARLFADHVHFDLNKVACRVLLFFFLYCQSLLKILQYFY